MGPSFGEAPENHKAMENETVYSEEIEKVINQKNTECRLYGSPECEFLNSGVCSDCEVGKLRHDRQEEAKKAIGRLMEAAPQEELEPLYTSHECLFCKGKKNKAELFGLLDLSKRDPEGDWTVAIGKRKLGVKAQDMILPLQLSACRECAAKHRALAYIPMLVGVIIAAAGLFVTTASSVYKPLYNVAPFVPALVMLGFVLLAIAVCFILKRVMKNAYGKRTHLSVSEIPELKPFLDRGFKEVADVKQGVSQVVFSKTFREHGIGSLVRPVSEDGGEEPVLMGIWPAENPCEPEEDPGKR